MVCIECKREINVATDFDRQPPVQVPDGWMHDACYYEGLGDLIEQHPIGAVHAATRRKERTP